jgi:hypothetical protein
MTTMAATALVMITLVALAIAHFVTRNVIANPIAHVLLPLHLSACDEEGNGEGNKSNDNCDKECDGDGGKSSNDGNSNKEGKDKGGKRDGDGNAEGNGKDRKGNGNGNYGGR